MKTLRLLYTVFQLLPLAMTLAVLPYLPQQIPAHYGFDGRVDRWGSKYEALILPAIVIVFGLAMRWVARRAARQQQAGGNEKVCLLTGALSLLLFDLLTVYFLYTAFAQAEDLSAVAVDLYRLVCGFLGVFWVILGSVMPRVRKNSLVGLRTPWSMKNETTWKKSQRFGGITLIAAGLLTLLVCLLAKGPACMLWSLGILLLTTVVDTLYTWRAAQKY